MEVRVNDVQKAIVEQLSGKPVKDGYVSLRRGDLLYSQLRVLADTSEDPEIYIEIMDLLDAADGYQGEAGVV